MTAVTGRPRIYRIRTVGPIPADLAERVAELHARAVQGEAEKANCPGESTNAADTYERGEGGQRGRPR